MLNFNRVVGSPATKEGQARHSPSASCQQPCCVCYWIYCDARCQGHSLVVSMLPAVGIGTGASRVMHTPLST